MELQLQTRTYHLILGQWKIPFDTMLHYATKLNLITEKGRWCDLGVDSVFVTTLLTDLIELTVNWFFITPCWLIEFDIVENKRRRRAGDIRAVYRVIINYSVFVSSARQSWQDRSSSPSFSRSDSCCDSSACDLCASDTVVWLVSLCDSNTDQRCDCYLELWLKNQPEELCKSKVKASDA